ncbi:MAG: DinB family protein [Sediminibacterium sp.]
MKTNLFIFGLFISIAGFAQNNELLIQGHLIKFKNAKTYTLAIAEKLDANNYAFKPVKEEMSFNEQLVHIAENIYWLSSTYIKEESNPVKGKKIIAQEMNKEQVIQFVSDAYEYGLKAMESLDENTLTNSFNWSGGKMNKYQFLNLIQDHQAHHVGQLIVYLRLNAIAPPKYIGW